MLPPQVGGLIRLERQNNYKLYAISRRVTLSILITFTTAAASAGGTRHIRRSGGETFLLNAGTGAFNDNDTVDSIATTSIQPTLDTNAPAGRNWITEIIVIGLGSNPFGGGGTFATTIYSTDHGATIDSAEIVGTSPANHGGIDTIKVGDVVLAGQSAKVRTAQSGGVYADEANGAVAGSNPAMMVIPYYRFNSTTKNISDATPEYLLGADVAVGGAALWRVTDGGKADVSKTIGAVLGLVTHPNAGAFSWYDNGKYAVLVNVSGVIHLITSTDGGTNWTDRGAIDADAIYVRMNKADPVSTDLFIADGGAGPAYSLNFGADIINQPWPSADNVILIEPYSGIG